MFLKKEISRIYRGLGINNLSLLKLFCTLLLLSITWSTSANTDKLSKSIAEQINSMQSTDRNFSAARLQGDTLASGSIIGGIDASRGEYEEYALLVITDDSGNVTGMCGSTLISTNTVLTAAHCADNPNRNYFAIPGFYSFNDDLEASDMISASRVQVHPQYDEFTRDNDVAVITLSEFSSEPTAAVYNGERDLTGTNGTVIGTGFLASLPAFLEADTLQEVPAPIIGNEACNDAWENLIGIRIITENMLCAGFDTDNRGTCFGDSGGPLFINFNGVRTVVATVSFGTPNCEENRGNQGYARTSALSDFIRSASPNTRFITDTNSLGNPFMPPIMILLEESE